MGRSAGEHRNVALEMGVEANFSSWKYRIDLHVHTRRYSPCAESLDPDLLSQTMKRKGLHGLVIAEHDQLWPLEEIRALNKTMKNMRIYRGVEVSSKNGHFIVIGLDELNGIHPGMGVEELVRQVRRSEAAIIWAHPLFNYNSVPTPLPAVLMPRGLDAIEVSSGVTQGEHTYKALGYAREMGWTAVCGSDAHALGQVGSTYTRFARLPKNEKSLAAAIRSGRCRIMSYK